MSTRAETFNDKQCSNREPHPEHSWDEERPERDKVYYSRWCQGVGHPGLYVHPRQITAYRPKRRPVSR